MKLKVRYLKTITESKIIELSDNLNEQEIEYELNDKFNRLWLMYTEIK